jgi:hypothetical protein
MVSFLFLVPHVFRFLDFGGIMPWLGYVSTICRCPRDSAVPCSVRTIYYLGSNGLGRRLKHFDPAKC